jgi:hypothetical protein
MSEVCESRHTEGSKVLDLAGLDSCDVAELIVVAASFLTLIPPRAELTVGYELRVGLRRRVDESGYAAL